MVELTLSLGRQGNDHAPGFLRRSLRAVTTAAVVMAASAVRPHKASLRRLAEMPLTIAGSAGIDFSAFHANHAIGWLVTGVSLLIIEHMIGDDDDGRRA